MKDGESLIRSASELSKKHLYFQYMMYVVFIMVSVIFISRDSVFFVNGVRDLWNVAGGNIFLTIALVISALFAMVLSVSAGGYPCDDFRPALIFYGFLISAFCQIFAVLALQAWEWGFLPAGLTFLLVHFLSGYLIGGTQKDVTEKKVPDNILYIIAEFWLLLPITGFGWGMSWVYHSPLCK